MKQHWSKQLGNVSNDSLEETWEIIADTFKQHITNHDKPALAKKWMVLSPPTGAGKTQSTILYCSMLSDLPDSLHPGVIIITRLTEDCDEIARQINELGSRPTAISFHSKQNTVTHADLKHYPVIVITHRAYEQALDFLGPEGTIQTTWPLFHEFGTVREEIRWSENVSSDYAESGTRKLVIVDEALDIIDHSQASLDDIRQTIGLIPQWIRDRHPREMLGVESTVNYLERIATRPGKKLETMQTNGEPSLDGNETFLPDLKPLIDDFSKIRFDHKQHGKDDPELNNKLRRYHSQVFRDLHHIFRTWCYYGKYKTDHTLNTARLLIPEGVKGAVVLDATASTSVVYELHADAEMIPTPDNCRTYQNVTCHVSRGHNVGKNHMVKSSKQGTSDLMQELEKMITGKDRNIFIVCHKKVEPNLLGFKTSFNYMTGHWGSIDGSNTFRDCDTVVIYGFPYLPDYWTANVYMALQQPQDTEWLQDASRRQYGDHADIRAALKNGQISTNIIQAINRIRSRKVIDTVGNCPHAEIYILLPQAAIPRVPGNAVIA